MKKLALLVLLTPLPAHANRAVMEMLAASNNTVYVDTVNARVGISTSVPRAILDVAGNAAFGTTVKSTFTVTGDLNLANNADLTLTGASAFITAPSSINAQGIFAGSLTLVNKLGVASGGTGSVSMTQNGVTYGNGTSGLGALPAMGANGIVTGNGVGNIPSTGTLTGTSNQVTVTQTGSNVVLATPQSIDTGANPTFNNLTLAGNTFSVGTSSFSVTGGSATVAYRMTVGSLNLSGTNPLVHQSTRTINLIPTYTTTQTTFGPCITGSTVSFTTSSTATFVLIGINGVVQDASGANIQVTFLQNGAFVNATNKNSGYSNITVTASSTENILAVIMSPVTGSTAYSWCASLNTNTGTASFNGSAADFNNQVWVYEAY